MHITTFTIATIPHSKVFSLMITKDLTSLNIGSQQAALTTPPRGYSLHSPPPSSPNPLLRKPTLKDLTSELYITAASKWEIIGIQLQLDPGKLDTFKTKEDEAALIEVLKMWLRTVDPPPTWKVIIDAVRLFNPSLAASLTTKYST